MSKLRTDSWASALTEEQSWQLYYKSRALRWNEAADWAVKEYGVEAPSRTAFYAWLGRMRGEESAHRLEQAKISAMEAAAMAKSSGLTDEETEAAYKRMAVNLSFATNSAKEASRFVEMAASIADRRLRAAELKLKTAAQETKDEQLKLAREKFEAAERRENAAKATVADNKLSDEERMAKLREIYGI